MNKQLLLLSIGSIATVMLLVGASQEAEAAGYMKLGSIKGESTDEAHKEWIELLSFSHEINRESKASGATRNRGGATFGDIMVGKQVDKSTPKLQEAIAMGTTFPLAEIEFTRSVGERGEDTYLRYELKNVLVSSYSISGDVSGDQILTDTISMTFAEIKVTYTEFDKETGERKGQVAYSWKVEEGTK